MKKTIFLGMVFSIYACANQGNERNENIPTVTGVGDTTILPEDTTNLSTIVNDTSTVIAYDTAARKPQAPVKSGGTR